MSAHSDPKTLPEDRSPISAEEMESVSLDDPTPPTGQPIPIIVTREHNELESSRSENVEEFLDETTYERTLQSPPASIDTPRSGPQTPQPTDDSRSRTDSQSTLATTTARPIPKSSLLFVVSSLESIAASKEARRSKPLSESVQRALTAIKGDTAAEPLNPEVLFEPLNLASQTPNVQVVTTALDCIGKLISYSYFSMAPPAGQDAPPLIERAIDTICDCFQSEATPVETQLQIVKSLLSAILNDKIVVHGAGLLKAVRATYNVFLMSKSSANQTVSQGALTQMVGRVFERVKERLESKEKRLNATPTQRDSSADTDHDDGEDEDEDEIEEDGEDDSEITATSSADVPVEKRDGPKITLQSFEHRKSFDDAKITEAAPTLVTRAKPRKHNASRSVSGAESITNGGSEHVDHASEDEEDEIYVRDAYLVFRAMCKLTIKALPVEHAIDVKSQGMRSKLISLHIIYTILSNHAIVFLSPYSTIRSSANDEPTSFVHAIKQYLCLSLSRNGSSSVKPVFQITCEIFWLMIKLLRVMLKKEIEVFLKEIYLAVLEKRAAPVWQKQAILGMFSRLAGDPRALVEVYLNYDCDRTALDNMFERIVEHLSRISSTPVAMTPVQLNAYHDHLVKGSTTPTDSRYRSLPPSLATVSMQGQQENDQGYPAEYAMKHDSLEVLVEILRSLVNWSQGSADVSGSPGVARTFTNESRESFDRRDGAMASPRIVGTDSPMGATTPMVEDDPSQFDREKQRKTAMAQAIRQFNFKPKRGIKTLIKDGFIKSTAPEDIARFLLFSDQINKSALGEFLGEGDKENVDIMHAFVEQMEFRQTRFVDALRRFLQSFRLPGEAQKIDRFMLKFAERYIKGNPDAFANADTAYVLAYSVIMLNTDQHSSNVVKRMTPEDFIKNNRGINDNNDLPDDYLRAIYDEIQHNEIVLNTERETAANLGQINQPSTGLAATIGQAVANAGRDYKREEYKQTEEIANRTEQLYKSLLRAQRRGATSTQVARFVPATSFKHVGWMFQVTWMPFLTALSGAAQDTSNLETVKLCMEGQKLAIRIACLFDLESPRQAFVASLARFTNLYNLSEMKAKNMEALKVLLEVAYTEGNSLKDSWRDILTCVSQLDRFQLISTGVDEGILPDVQRQHSQSKAPPSRRSLAPKPRPRVQSGNASYQADIAEESRSVDIVRGVDRIFTNTAQLDGDAILHFVKALTQVSWQEIQSSGQSESPRTYSLQKIVEISGYNMTRVRFQWANIWQVLGQHFNQVGCHTNTHVVYFALDSLRQLSMRFMEIEELPGFKFQKDFLKPFEHIIKNSTVVAVKDMVLRCLIQMIQARGDNIRSGWRTMFGVFTVAAKEPYENIVNLAYDHVTQIYNNRFGVVISQGAFADLVVCLQDFAKNQKFQKKSLQAIELLKSSVDKLLRTPECPLSRKDQNGEKRTKEAPSSKSQSEEEQYWFPVLFAFHEILMNGEDLEVRSRALNYLFATLEKYGGDFPLDFWDTIWRQLLYPIFMVLRSKSEMSKVVVHEELSVWLSTTMVQALRNMITLFTHFFESLEYMLDRFLELLILCICQENDTLARIGSNCLQQIILQNVKEFSDEDWHKIVDAFMVLFQRTEATALFAAVTTGSFTPRQTSTNGDAIKSPLMEESQSFDNLSLTSTSVETPITEHPEPNLGLGINTASDRPRADWGSMGAIPQDNGGPPMTEDDDGPLAGDLEPPKTPTYHTNDLESYRPPSSLQATPVPVTAARRRFFNQIITQCVLTLLMIETVNELLTNDKVYAQMPSTELLRLMGVLKKSYHFARKFNHDRELRTRLFKEGFMKQPPNLLKQESGAAATYVAILLRMYHDPNPARVGSRAQTEAALVPLCADILKSYLDLDDETQGRNILTWRPVVVDVLEGYSGFERAEFEKYLPQFAPLVVGLMGRELTVEFQTALQRVVARIVEVSTGVDCREHLTGSNGRGGSRRPSLRGGR